jgi:hypothetical protein
MTTQGLGTIDPVLGIGTAVFSVVVVVLAARMYTAPPPTERRHTSWRVFVTGVALLGLAELLRLLGTVVGGTTREALEIAYVGLQVPVVVALSVGLLGLGNRLRRWRAHLERPEG